MVRNYDENYSKFIKATENIISFLNNEIEYKRLYSTILFESN